MSLNKQVLTALQMATVVDCCDECGCLPPNKLACRRELNATATKLVAFLIALDELLPDDAWLPNELAHVISVVMEEQDG